MSQAQATNSHALIMVGLRMTAPHQVVTPQVLLGDYDANAAAGFRVLAQYSRLDGAPVLGTLRLPWHFFKLWLLSSATRSTTL